MTNRLVIRLRTCRNLQNILEHGESPAWIVAKNKESRITDVEVINFEGSQIIVGKFDPVRSRRREDGRLIVAFKDGKLNSCRIPYECQASVRYFE